VDGFKYPTVQLGNQCWTNVNLKTKHKPDWNPSNPTLDEGEYLIDGRFCDGLKCNTNMGAFWTSTGYLDAEIDKSALKLCGINSIRNRKNDKISFLDSKK